MAKKPNIKAMQKKDASLDKKVDSGKASAKQATADKKLDKKLGANDQDKGKDKFDFKAFIASKKKK